MLQEAVDEVQRPQRTALLCAGLGVAITKGHAVIFQLEQAVVAQSNPENVGRQVPQGIETRPHFFTMDHPFLLPNPGRDAGITICLTQCLLQPGAKYSRERSHREKEVVAGGHPAMLCLVPPACRNEIVNVRMVRQVASPGMQHPHHPDLAANPAWLLCQLLGGCCGCFEEQVVEQALVRTGHFVEARRQREGQQEIRYMQEQALLPFQPDLCVLRLAFGTVAVATRVVAILQLLTTGTAVDLSAQSRRAALFYSPHRLEVGAGHPAGILLAV